jgi:hypothetical protein
MGCSTSEIDRGWNENFVMPQSSRLLELADVVLGAKKKGVPK